MSNASKMTATEFLQAQLSRRRLLRTAAAAGAAGAALPGSLRWRAAAAQADKPLTIAFSVPGLNFPFFVHMMDLAEQHAAELGNITFVPLDGQQNGAPSSTKQSADLEAQVANKVDGIVISPNDGVALAESVQAAIDAGIPVVTVDRTVNDVATLAHVGADNVRGGEIQGEYVISLLLDGGDIFELQGQPGATPAIDRHAGLEAAIATQDAVKIVQSQTAEFAREKAVSVMEGLLAANEPPAAVVCANDDMAFGVAQVVEDNDLTIPIIGFDALPEALQSIQSGALAATIEQFPGQQASTALDILVAFLREGTEVTEHDTYLEPLLVNADNLAAAERAVEAGVAPGGTPVATPAS